MKEKDLLPKPDQIDIEALQAKHQKNINIWERIDPVLLLAGLLFLGEGIQLFRSDEQNINNIPVIVIKTTGAISVSTGAAVFLAGLAKDKLSKTIQYLESRIPPQEKP
jgi:hypothetical protein